MQSYAGRPVSVGEQRNTVGETAGLIGLILGIIGLILLGTIFTTGMTYNIGMTFGMAAVALGIIALIKGSKGLGAASLAVGIINVVLTFLSMFWLMSTLAK